MHTSIGTIFRISSEVSKILHELSRLIFLSFSEYDIYTHVEYKKKKYVQRSVGCNNSFTQVCIIVVVAAYRCVRVISYTELPYTLYTQESRIL